MFVSLIILVAFAAFPGPGNVLEFYKIMNCPGKNIGCEKIYFEQKSL